jgi:hypothetical protein
MKKIMCYIIGIITLFLVIIIIKRFMFQEEIESISYEVKSYNKIEYPYFNNKVINKEIKNFLNNFLLSVLRHVPDNIFYRKGVFNGNYTANPK